MRKLIAIFFLIPVFFTQVGYYFMYSFQQKQLRREMKKEIFAGIPLSELELIDPSTAGTGFQWKEEDKEFYLHDEMYDIVSTKEINGKIYYYCINDKKEKKLLKNFTDAVRGSHHGRNGNKQGKQVIKFQLPVFVLSKLPDDVAGLVIDLPSFGSLEQHFVSICREINDPPPKA